MKKTNTINLGGIIFHIEEDAFIQLQNYLNAIRSYFSKSEGQEEIIVDIEYRIAEILQEKNISIITTIQVDEVVSIMGKPEDYEDGKQDEKITKPIEKEQRIRKIFRHPDDKILGGVCGGLGAYFNVDPVLFRLGFLLTMLIGGFGFFVYLILWVIAPGADRASDHLEMRGEPVTAETIGRAVASKIEDTVINENNQSIVRKILAGIGSVFGFFIEVFRRFFIVFGKFIKPVAGVILLLFGLIAAMGLSFITMVVTRFVYHSEFQEMVLTLDSILEHFPLHHIFVILGFALFVSIPLFQLIYLGLRLLFNMAQQSSTVKSIMAGLWIIGFFFMIFFGIIGGVNFSEDARIEITNALMEVKTGRHPLRISLNVHDNFFWDERSMRIEETDDGKYKFISDVELNVTRSPDSHFHLKIVKRASARSFRDARGYAENISYHYFLDSGHVQLDQYFKISSDDTYQKQSIELTLLVPTGKSIYLDESLKYFIYDIKNTTNTHDYKMVGHNWAMGDDGLFNEFFKKKSSMNKTKKIKFIEKSKIQDLGLEKRLIQLEETLEDLEDLEKETENPR